MGEGGDPGAQRQLAAIAAAVRERFEAEKRVLTFDEYLALLAAEPARHTRDAARWLRDCFDWFGTYEVDRPWGKQARYRLFDLEFETKEADDSRRLDRLVAHEPIQLAVYR